MKRFPLVGALAALFVVAPAPSMAADAFPAKPISIVVPYGPGGGNDLLAREIGAGLQARLGQPVIVENKLGAGGAIGVAAVSNAPADGYTLLMAANSNVMNAILEPSSPDIEKNFRGVAKVATIPLVLVVTPSLPAQDVPGLIKALKDAPGSLNYGSAGRGTVQHMTALMFMDQTGTRMTHVPFKGNAQIVPELVTGRVQVLFGPTNSLLQSIRAGSLKALAVTTRLPDDALPGVPSVASAGLPDFDVDVWYGILAPIKTPDAIVSTLNKEIAAVMREPAVIERLRNQGLKPEAVGDPAAVSLSVKNDVARWTSVAQRTRSIDQ